MNADIKVIRLIRKNIRQNDVIGNNDADGQGIFFATDYFDLLKVDNKELEYQMSALIGIWPDEKLDAGDIAVQSYSIYCSEEMLQQEEGKKGCGDPFKMQMGAVSLPYLSMVQVHITPEITAHLFPDKSAGEFMQIIYSDILEKLVTYAESHEIASMIFRVYKMLSVGDFAVMVRSGKAMTSFQIASMLRREVIKCKNGYDLILYKTYTLLTIADRVIHSETEKDNVEAKTVLQGQFVIRGCYSNLYWSEKEDAEEEMKQLNITPNTELFGLNGRYDFTIRLNERQFLSLLGDIWDYKEKGNISSENVSGDSNVQYIHYLMKNHYLSYINERYLVEQNKNEERTEIVFDAKEGNAVCGDINDRKAFMDYRIKNHYEDVLGKCKKTSAQIAGLTYYRKNMNHYMNLLQKLTELCFGISGLSDTRIYAAALLEQIDVIIDSIDLYLCMYRENEQGAQEEIVDLLEDYIRESVCALDSYAQCIRNNNLQSLQTPNYNIECNMSMEKLLIAYGEVLRTFINYYQSQETSREGQCQYLPMVVPELYRQDVSVEVLFPEGLMVDWNTEKEKISRMGEKYNRKCMVIRVPTLTELGHVQNMVSTLFHEMAHQLRYEEREKRNDALLYYLIHAAMNMIAGEMIRKIQNEIGRYDWQRSLWENLAKYLTEAYIELNYKNEMGNLEYDFRYAPLSYFKYCLDGDIQRILGRCQKRNDIVFILNTFLKDIMHYYVPDKSQCPEAIEILSKMFAQITGEEVGEEINEELYHEEKIVKCMFGIIWECACQQKEVRRLWTGNEFKSWLDTEENVDYRTQWENTFGKENVDFETVEGKLWGKFFYTASWIYENCGNKQKTYVYNRRIWEKFTDSAYQKCRIGWKTEVKQQLNEKNDFMDVVAQGRALGIDCTTEENKKIFEEILADVVSRHLDSIREKTEWRIGRYREETADIFMCNAMQLTPFGYLYILAVSWPETEELDAEYYSRCQNVILFQWCLDDKEELSGFKYRKVCLETIKTLEKAIAQTTFQCGIEEMFQFRNIKWDGQDPFNDESGIEDATDYLNELIEYCNTMQNDFQKREIKSCQERENCKFFKIIARLLDEMICNISSHMIYLENFQELRKDYIRGVRKLDKLNDLMCNDSDLSVKRLGEFCKKISELQNDPCIKVNDPEKIADFNKSSIEFLLDMYYSNKRRVASKIGEKIDV